MDSIELSSLMHYSVTDTIASSVSLEFLHYNNTISASSKQEVAPGIKSHNLWCQARILHLPVSLVSKMSASKHSATFGF